MVLLALLAVGAAEAVLRRPAVAAAARRADDTDWGAISPDLLAHWAGDLPPVPQTGLDLSAWQPVDSQGPFQVIVAALENSSFCVADPTAFDGAWPASVQAGPTMLCSDQSPCSSGYTAASCKAQGSLYNRDGLVVLLQRNGGYWAPQSAQPVWAQLRFPVPAGAGSVTFRFTMDERYAPLARGGNPCAAAAGNASHRCTLCTSALHGGPWDFEAAAGVHLLWAAPGAERHIITGPIDVYSAHRSGERTLTVDSPAELDLSGHAEVVITLLAFNQYPYTGELVEGEKPLGGYSLDDPTRCSVEWTRNSTAGDASGGNAVLILMGAEIFTRSVWAPPSTPPPLRPRLFGSDDTWADARNAPFFTADCPYDTAVSPGWGGASGIPDFKSAFERATLGYATCCASGGSWSTPPASIDDHPYVRATYGDPAYASFSGHTSRSDALKVFHLVRRLRACHNANAGTCQFDQNATEVLARVIVEREFQTFDPDAREVNSDSWGWEQDTDGCCGYDLFSAVTVKHFSLFVDIFRDDAQSLNATRLGEIETKLEQYADHFMGQFRSGHWSLWNGNNWTPVLSAGAVYWAVAFWHERPEKARALMHQINDVAMLHRAMTADDGMYKEGLCQYSYMSVLSTLEIAVLYASAFGGAWPGADAGALQATAQWQMDSFDTAGYAVDFGDSHQCRGSQVATLYAAMAPAIVAPAGTAGAVQVDGCLLRTWSAVAYWLTVDDPWTFWPQLLSVSSWGPLDLAAACSAGAAPGLWPLGPARVQIYPSGGYGVMRSPLATECGEDKPGCDASQATMPALEDVALYSMLALQARPNEFPHSEVDFATLKWSSHGVHFLTEYGYGTIATSTGKYDARRYAYIDNNPAGHNTVVVREAFSSGSTVVNFAQLPWERGTIAQVGGAGLQCIHLDGSEVYGSSRPDGWLGYMHRWSCLVGSGSFLVIDAFAALPNRSAMSLYGSQYHGPDFNEGAAHPELVIDEFFHAPSWLNGQDISGMDEAAKVFSRSLAGSRCSHVDVEAGAETSPTVYLRQRCGPFGQGEGDHVGRITAWSTGGGQFELDGLQSAANRWGGQTLHAHRFRYTSPAAVGPEGDVRAFLLSSWQENSSSPARAARSPAASLAPCVGAAGVTCVSACVGTECVTVSVAASHGAAPTLSASAGGDPTPSPTPAVSGTGDPHLQNILGQRFDLMQPGRHTLINIPKWAKSLDALLRVEANAQPLGAHCAGLYFLELNVTGDWAEAARRGGLRFRAGSSGGKQGYEWMSLGRVDLKVVHGRTQEGNRYLNLYARLLGRAGLPVGGLLGEDDHTAAEAPSRSCVRSISLRARSAAAGRGAPPASAAEASAA